MDIKQTILVTGGMGFIGSHTAVELIEAGYKVVQIVGTDAEVEDVCMMKTFKPSANEYKEGNKIFVVKVAQDMNIDDSIKTVKYALPVFADNNEQLQTIMKDYISQGLDDMRLTTISETKWIFI